MIRSPRACGSSAGRSSSGPSGTGHSQLQLFDDVANGAVPGGGVRDGGATSAASGRATGPATASPAGRDFGAGGKGGGARPQASGGRPVQVELFGKVAAAQPRQPRARAAAESGAVRAIILALRARGCRVIRAGRRSILVDGVRYDPSALAQAADGLMAVRPARRRIGELERMRPVPGTGG